MVQNPGSGRGTLNSWGLQVYGGCFDNPCENGGTCVATGWAAASFTCVCPHGISGPICANGALGTNFNLFSAAPAHTTTVPGSWVYHSLQVNLPFTIIDWTVAVVLVPLFSTPNLGSLTISLTAPNGFSAVVLVNGQYVLSGCNSGRVAIFDNCTAAVGSASPPALCHAAQFSGLGLFYSDPTSTPTCFVPGCDVSNFIGTWIGDPFAATFQKGTAAASGVWTLGIYDTNPTAPSNLTKWALQFYGKDFVWSCVLSLLSSFF